MKFEVDTDTILETILDKITKNVEDNAKAQGLDADEVAATVTLNKKKLAVDAQNLAVFFTSMYVATPEVVQEAVTE